MTDRREAILARLEIVVRSAGFTCNRMDPEPPRNDLPAIVINDGGESILNNEEEQGLRGGVRPTVVQMAPVLGLLMKTSGSPGPDVNAQRLKIIKAVLGDATLAGLCQPPGAMRYAGCEQPEVGIADAFVPDMNFGFHFRYILNHREL